MGIQKRLERGVYGILFVQATPRKRDRRGALRLHTSMAPGVLIISSLDCSVTPYPVRSHAAKELYARGRLMGEWTSCSTPAYHALFRRWRERELNCMGKHPCVLGGDWNLDPRALPMTAKLEARGWRFPLPIDHNGHAAAHTYQEGRHRSFLEGFMASPEITQGAWTQMVRYVASIAHATVQCALTHALDTQETCYQVRFPPRICPMNSAAPLAFVGKYFKVQGPGDISDTGTSYLQRKPRWKEDSIERSP